MTDQPAKLTEFLQMFFGPGNQLGWEEIQAGASPMANRMAPWLVRLRRDAPRPRTDWRPVLLPRTDANGNCRFYALSFQSADARALRDDLLAFVGPSYSDFDGQATPLDLSDPIERAAHDFTDGFAFRFNVLANNLSEVWSLLDLMRELSDQKPKRPTRWLRPKGRILRDFEMALRSRSWATADRCLEELREGGHLDAKNLAFLKVRRLAADGRWAEVLALPERPALIAERRPTLVTEALLQAIYATELAPYEDPLNPQVALDRFREWVLPMASPLLRTQSGLRSPEVLKAFLLKTGTAHPIDRDKATTLFDTYPREREDWPFVKSLADLILQDAAPVDTAEVLPEVSIRDQAEQALNTEDFDKAFELLLQCEPDTGVLRDLLECAAEIHTLDATRNVLAAFERATAEDREAALTRRMHRKLWEELTSTEPATPTGTMTPTPPSADTLPDNWMSWLERVNKPKGWPQASAVAQQGAAEWDREMFRHRSDLVMQFAEVLDAERQGFAKNQLRDAVPSMLGNLLPADQPPLSELKPIYFRLLKLLAWQDVHSDADLDSIYDLTEAVLSTGLSAGGETNEFASLVELFEWTWDVAHAPKHIPWVLDVLDLLTVFAVQERASLGNFLSTVLSHCMQGVRHLDGEHWQILRMICSDLNQAELFESYRQAVPEDHAPPETSTDEPDLAQRLANRLQGKMVAVYTLNESVGQRVQTELTTKFPNLDVRVNHEHDASDRLCSLAREADYFLVATRCAKHMATECIDQNRKPGGETLYASGKGSSSLLAALYSSVG